MLYNFIKIHAVKNIQKHKNIKFNCPPFTVPSFPSTPPRSCCSQTSSFISFTNSHCTNVHSAGGRCISVSVIGTDWEKQENCRRFLC